MQFFIRVNVETKDISKIIVPDEYKHLSGRGLTSRLLLDEVDPICSPLGSGNKIIFAPGILGGTEVPCSGRLSVGAKSPLTGGIKESNAGGTAGHKISRLGIKAIIIEGEPKGEWDILVIGKNGAYFESAIDLIGSGNYETSDKLRQKYGKRASIISIGQAGEYCLPVSGIAVSDIDGKPNRFAGRGGMGAVLGSKKIKAIIIDDSDAEEITYHNKQEFKALAMEMIRELREHPNVKIFNKYGTSFNMNVVNEMGGIPTRNFSKGNYEKIYKVSG